MNWKIRFALLVAGLFLALGSGSVSAQSPTTPSPKMTNQMRVVKQRVQLLTTTIKKTASRIEEASRGIKKNMEALEKQSVSDIAYEDVYRMLQLQKVELVIELQGLDARSLLLQQKVDSSKLETSATEKLQRDLFDRNIAIAEKSYKTTLNLHKKGARSKEALNRAELQVAAAKLRKTEFEKDLKAASPEYVEALFEATLGIAERKAKLQTVEKLLQSHIDSRPQMTELNDLTEVRKTESARLNELMFELKELEAQATQLEY